MMAAERTLGENPFTIGAGGRGYVYPAQLCCFLFFVVEGRKSFPIVPSASKCFSLSFRNVLKGEREEP